MHRILWLEAKVDDTPQFREAIMYLFFWGSPLFDELFIRDDVPKRNKKDMIAYYKSSKKGCTYTIGAIWDEEKQSYSFHS